MWFFLKNAVSYTYMYVSTYLFVCQDESFVEDINMLLNTGEVPNLYPPDEKAEIIEKMQVVARTQVRAHT